MTLNFDMTPTVKTKIPPIHLTVKEVVDAALANWDRVACNNPGVYGCRYFCEDEKDTRCVVGIAFKPEDRLRIESFYNRNYGVIGLMDREIITVDEPKELWYLQKLHDEAVMEESSKRQQKIDALRKELERLQKKYLTSSSN